MKEIKDDKQKIINNESDNKTINSPDLLEEALTKKAKNNRKDPKSGKALLTE